MAHGYEVSVNGEIDISTVSATRQAAKVNGLVTVFGVVISAAWTEVTIANEWAVAERTHHAMRLRIVPVTIEEAEL